MKRAMTALLSTLAVSATAAPGLAAVSQKGVDDPFEGANRLSFLATGAADTVLIRPVSVFYAHATPKLVRSGVHNVLGNLSQPVYFLNRVLQLRPSAAAKTFGRFAINSTAGVGGLVDVAAAAGLTDAPTGFAQTLGRYGVGAGPYVFLPLFGPSSVRDAIGQAADIVSDPLFWVRFEGDTAVVISRSALSTVDARVLADPALKDLQATATDPYAALRAAYVQNASFLQNGGKIDVQSLPDFDSEPAAKPPDHP